VADKEGGEKEEEFVVATYKFKPPPLVLVGITASGGVTWSRV